MYHQVNGVETLPGDGRMGRTVFCSLGGIPGFSGSWWAMGTAWERGCAYVSIRMRVV